MGLVEKNTSIFRYFSIRYNILLGYMLWDGINFEDRITATEIWIIAETFFNIHNEKWGCDKIFIGLIRKSIRRQIFMMTTVELIGLDRTYVTRMKHGNFDTIDNCYFFDWAFLNTFGLIRVGTWVERNNVIALVLKKYDFLKKKQFYIDLIKEILVLNLDSVFFYVPLNIIGRICNVYINKIIHRKWRNILKYIVNNKFSSFFIHNHSFTRKYYSKKRKVYLLFRKTNLFIPSQKKNIILYIKFCKKRKNIETNWGNLRKFYIKMLPMPIQDIYSQFYYIRIVIIIALYYRTQVGDKVSRNHGNKGILERMIPFSEILFLLNGISLDLILNPLSIPSRIIIGIIYEILFRLAGFLIKEAYFFF